MGYDELARSRRDEIVNACAELYESMSFKDITLREIGERTSFTRTSIYNYFHTKEEIFLELFKREYEAWTDDLLAVLRGHERLSPREFADELSRTLERRERLLKLMSMNLYDMEGARKKMPVLYLKNAEKKFLPILLIFLR